jgi:hypothetical protein
MLRAERDEYSGLGSKIRVRRSVAVHDSCFILMLQRRLYEPSSICGFRLIGDRPQGGGYSRRWLERQLKEIAPISAWPCA